MTKEQVQEWITEPARQTPVRYEYDVVVAGGGHGGRLRGNRLGPARCGDDSRRTLRVLRRQCDPLPAAFGLSRPARKRSDQGHRQGNRRPGDRTRRVRGPRARSFARQLRADRPRDLQARRHRDAGRGRRPRAAPLPRRRGAHGRRPRDAPADRKQVGPVGGGGQMVYRRHGRRRLGGLCRRAVGEGQRARQDAAGDLDVPDGRRGPEGRRAWPSPRSPSATGPISCRRSIS